MGEVKRYTVLGKPRMTSGNGDVIYPVQNIDYFVTAKDHDATIKRLRDALQRIVILLEDPADAEMASEYAYQIAVDAISDHPAQKTCVYHFNGHKQAWETSCGNATRAIVAGWKTCPFGNCGLPIEIKE